MVSAIDNHYCSAADKSPAELHSKGEHANAEVCLFQGLLCELELSGYASHTECAGWGIKLMCATTTHTSASLGLDCGKRLESDQGGFRPP